MKDWKCKACLRTMPLKSRCIIQIPINRWNGYCSNCCCLNNIRGKECDDVSGLGWIKYGA